MRHAPSKAPVLALIISALALSLLPPPAGLAAADPWIVTNPDGTSDAVWNFTNPADYVLSGISIAAGTASLATQTDSWNSTSAGDFAGPDSETNVDRTTWPGNLTLASTGGASSLVSVGEGATGGDAYLNQANPATNYGASATLVLDGRNPTRRRPVIQYDLSAIPAAAVIDDAILSVYQSASAVNPLTGEVRLLTTAWAEGTVTWNTPWTGAGGDFNPFIVATLNLDVGAGWKTANITQLVDVWHRGARANLGLILTAPNTNNADKTFHSFEGANPPRIDVRYRTLGATGEYVSKVGGPGTPTNWQSIAWTPSERSFVTDEFNGPSLDPKWTWTNAPPSFDLGLSAAGHLRINSTTGVDLDSATFTGHVLADGVVGDFVATMKFSSDPTVSGQKAGLMVLLNGRNWYAVQKVNASGFTNWQVKETVDATSVIPVNVTSGNPIPGWVRIDRVGDTFTAWTSDDGIAWTLRDTYAPTVQYGLHVRVAVFVADGLSSTTHSVDVDYVRVLMGADAALTLQTRTGDTSPWDPSWSAWSAPYGTPSGSAMAGTSRYTEFRLTLSVTYPDHAPDIGHVNITWSNYVASGTVETNDLVPGDVAEWGNFTVAQVLGGESIAYEYSTNSGGSWTPVVPPASLQSVSVASGTIRFRATLSTTNTVVTPTLSEMRLTYRHRLDHFHVTASGAATAGAPFTVTVTAKDGANATLAGWTGVVALEARLLDGVTPGNGILGMTSLAIVAGGTATLATETYTRAETVRIHASFALAEGLSGTVDVSPGALARIDVAPGNATLLLLDTLVFSGQGADAWDNPIASLSFDWTVTGGIGTLNTSTGESVLFTAGAVEGNGTLEAASGPVVGSATIRVVNGTRPWLTIATPVSGDRLTGTVPIAYSNSSDAVSVRFEYDGGSGWTLIGVEVLLDGIFDWNTSGVDFAGGSLRGIVENNRTVTNVTTVSPLEVDNTPPAISLGAAIDDQAGSGTITLTYAAATDVVRVDFAYFDGSWNGIGTDPTIDGTFVWTPGGPINGVTVRAVAEDEVGLQGSDEAPGIGRYTSGTNPPSVLAVPDLHVRTGQAYRLNLTFYIADADTPLASLAISTSDPGNVTVLGGPTPALDLLYAAPGTYTVTLWVSDGTDTAWVLLIVTASALSPPAIAANLPAVFFDEDETALNALGAALTGFFTDADGDPLTFTILDASLVVSRVNGDATLDLWAPSNAWGTDWLRIRATDPSGGFAESVFRVTVRPVNDAPVLLSLPEVSLIAGAAGTVSLAPYLSDVDNNLTDLAVTTDSPYVTVNGLILTLAFPGNWTQADVTITVSDGSATTQGTMRVTIVPGPPPWWTSPYVLAMPPVGILVVVAMFAQRARWRPAKAFLVDERGQMLREFTLDPSCQVTYDQAFEAGALDAVEKAVKVQRYHAQTVRGDALAVVLLAYGPVTPDQIEFAREMLVNIQDQFEDAVKARLEDARRYELELEAAAKRLEGSRTAFDAQSRAFAGMTDAITRAQTKMAAEATAVRAKVVDFERRELRLREDRTALDEMAIDLGGLRASLDARAKEIEDGQQELADREGTIEAQEESLADRTSQAARRETLVAEQESAVTLEIERVEKQSAELRERSTTIEEREAQLDKDRILLEEARQAFLTEKGAIESKAAEVGARESVLDERGRNLDAREARITPMEEDLAARGSSLADQESALLVRSDAVGREEAETEGRLQVLQEQEAAVVRRMAEIEEARTAFASERAAFEAATAGLRDREDRVVTKEAELTEREARLGPKEAELDSREKLLAENERAFQGRSDALAENELEATTRAQVLENRSVALRQERAEFDVRFKQYEGERKTLDVRAGELRELETYVNAKTKDIDERQARIGSKEAELAAREEVLGEREARYRSDSEAFAARVSELDGREKELKASETTLAESQTHLTAAQTAFEEAQQAFSASRTRFEEEARRRGGDLDTQAKTVGEQQLRLAREKESFDAEREEKTHWIASKEIDLEAREQSVAEKEAAVRAQAEENARQLSELASREETLEIEGDKLERVRAELELRKVDIETATKVLDARSAQLRDDEARKAEEYRTWQATLDSEQAMLREQRETFEKEMSDLRESWASRMMRLQQREGDLTEREAKVRADVEWVAKNEAEVARRETAAEEASKSASELRSTTEAARKEIEQKSFELQARERALREEAGKHAEDLGRRLKEIKSMETALADARGQFERDSAARMMKLQTFENEVAEKNKSSETKAAELAGREAQIQALEAALRDHEERFAREQSELQVLAKQLDERQVAITQARLRSEEESARFQLESEAVRRTLAQREAELQVGMERLTRESAALQDKLGTKAQEMAAREKALAAREAEVRAEEHDLEARIRDTESRERQLQAYAGELAAQAAALSKRQAELDARTADFDGMTKRFAEEEAAKRREWEGLQRAIRSQEAQLTADADARGKDIARQFGELERREHGLASAMNQLDMERSRLADATKALAAKETEAGAAWGRSEKRFAELQAMEAAILQNRQAFESERNAWAVRRSEELRQLEATRDAAAEQAQATERLIEEARRRANVATEAERVAKAKADEAQTLMAQLASRRAETEKGEQALQTQTSAFAEASRKLAEKDSGLQSKLQEIQGREAKLAATSQEAARMSEELRSRQVSVDQESTRLAKQAADLAGRKADADARHASAAAKAADLAERERILTTELQRAEGLMEDLGRKEGELRAQEKALGTVEGGLKSREASLAQKDAELREGLAALEKMRQELENRLVEIDEDRSAADTARREAVALKQESERAKIQAEEMQKEVTKNMKFLQKKAVDVLDREETIREREARVEDSERALAARAEIIETKERSLESDRGEALAKTTRMQTELERLRDRLPNAEKAAKPSAEMEEWKKEIDTRVKIIQKKAFDLLDREEKLRKREAEIRTRAEELGLTF